METKITMTAQDLATKLDMDAADLGLAAETIVTCWPDGRAQANLDGNVVDLTASMRHEAAKALRSSFRWFAATYTRRNEHGGVDGHEGAQVFVDGVTVAAFVDEDDALDAAQEGAEEIGIDPDDVSVEECDASGHYQ